MSDPVTAIVPIPKSGAELYRTSTDAANLCKEIVAASAKNIQGKRYVMVEGWMSIAIAHGCFASAGTVERVNDPEGPGYKATGYVRRADTGAIIAEAEGFVGDDEKTWASRAVYARRAMAQTRAISRACRSAFAHVVVMMKAGLETTPAEEVPHEGFEAPNATESELEEKLRATTRAVKAGATLRTAKANVKVAAEVLEGEIVDEHASAYAMPFKSRFGKWEKGAPIESLTKKDLEGLANWDGAKDDLKAAVAAELARRGEQ